MNLIRSTLLPLLGPTKPSRSLFLILRTRCYSCPPPRFVFLLPDIPSRPHFEAFCLVDGTIFAHQENPRSTNGHRAVPSRTHSFFAGTVELTFTSYAVLVPPLKFFFRHRQRCPCHKTNHHNVSIYASPSTTPQVSSIGT